MAKWLRWLVQGTGVKKWLLFALCGIFIIWQGVAWHYGGGVITLCLKLGLNTLANLLLKSTIWGAILAVVVGLCLLLYSFYHIIEKIVKSATNMQLLGMTSKALYNQQMQQGPKVVAIGGGTGLSVFLRAIKGLTANITAIVAVTDDGGSSGRLRRDLGILPPGDVRNCLIALSRSDEALEEVLAYNFPKDSGLAGHNLGNLLMAAIQQSNHTDFAGAVQKLSSILAIQGRVLPSTLDNVVISGIMADGDIVSGETKMVADKREIKEVFLTPKDCNPLPESLEAIAGADYIFIGPGSLYTSVITNLLVPGLADAIKEGKAGGAKIYYICNMTNQPGEMDKTKASHYVEAINKHIGCQIIDAIIVNEGLYTNDQIATLWSKGCLPVVCDHKRLKEFGVKVISSDLVNQENIWRHQHDKLVKLLAESVFGQHVPW